MILFYQNLITKLVINTSMLTLLIMMPMVIGATEMFGPRQVGDGIFTTYQLTPDGQQVVYSADEALFIANIDGGNATQIAEVEAGGIISNIKISANSQRIVFLAVETNLIFNTEVNFISSLHGVSSDGDNFFTYVESPFEQPFIDVGEFEITADSRRVVYLFNNGGRQALFSQSLDGGDEFAYNRNPANSLDIREAHSFELSPDGSTVVFIANNISNLSEVRLYSAPSSGAERTQLNDESQSPVSTSTQFSISPDNNFVLFPGGRVPLVGGTQIPLFDGISGRVSNITISPDSDHVIFLSNDDLFRISSTGGSPFKLSTGITDIGQVIGDYIISPDSQRVVFRVREDAADLSAGFDLYTVPLMGGATTRLNAPLSATRSVESFLVSPDSSYVAYFADHEGSPPSNFFSVPIMGGSQRLILAQTVDE